MAKDSSVHTKSGKELEKLLTDKRAQLRQMLLDLHTKEVKDVRAVRHLRRQIARILTIMHERTLGIREKQE